MSSIGVQPVRPNEVGSFYGRFRKPLLAFFRRRKSVEEAEDLTQEVFVRLARHPDLDGIDRSEAYVFQVAANLLRDDRRRAATRAAELHTPIESAMDERSVPPSLIETLDPERVLLGRWEAEAIAIALAAMPVRTRDIFVLHRLEKMRQRDIAAAMNISLSSVEKHLVKAIALLTKARGVG